MTKGPIKGRGTGDNPPNRFEKIWVQREDSDDPAPGTRFYRDSSKSIIARNDSPDIGFDAGINPYRGCEHGCVYCYARPTHEYLGFSAGLDFESKILVKENAPELLKDALSKKSWKPQVVAVCGNTDPYQPVERRMLLTRRCLEVFVQFRNPIVIITKNHLVTRDIDLLQKLAEHSAVHVRMSITTLDAELARKMEPRTSTPSRRLDALKKLNAAGVSAGVMIAPVIPGLTEHEIPAIIEEAKSCGARWGGYTIVRLPFAVKELFESWIDDHRPARKQKILNRIRDMRGGNLNDSRFGVRMRGEGIYARQIQQLFQSACRNHDVDPGRPELSAAAFRAPPGPQLDLFS